MVGLDALDVTGEQGLPGGGAFVVALSVEPEGDALPADKDLERGVVYVIQDGPAVWRAAAVSCRGRCCCSNCR